MKTMMIIAGLCLITVQSIAVAETNKSCERTAKKDFKKCSKKLLPWKVDNYLGKITTCHQTYVAKTATCNSGGGGGGTITECLDACQQDSLILAAECAGDRSVFNLSHSIEVSLPFGVSLTVVGVCDPNSSNFHQYGVSASDCDSAFYTTHNSCNPGAMFEVKDQCERACYL